MRVLQSLGQGREALPAQHHVRVGEAGVGQTEAVQAMVQRRAGDRHPQAVGVSEVRQPQLARRMGLAEDDFPFRTVHPLILIVAVDAATLQQRDRSSNQIQLR